MTVYQIISALGIPSLAGAILLSIFNLVKSKHSSNKLIRNGVIAILHNKIYTLGKQYIEREYVTIGDLKDFEYLYNAYHALGGKGNGKEIYEKDKNSIYTYCCCRTVSGDEL